MTPNATSTPPSSASTPKPEEPIEANGAAPVREAETPIEELRRFRESDEGKKIHAWVQEQFTNCRSAQSRKRVQWQLNLAFIFGEQDMSIAKHPYREGELTLKRTQTAKYVKRRKINRVRSFVRTEQSKFVSTFPSIVSVPSTGDEDDTRAAYAAEQVWQSYSDANQLRRVYASAMYWKIATGNGFMKVWWDNDKSYSAQPGITGDICYKSVSPFNLFVPDLLTREIDDQPYVIEAQARPVEWVKRFYAEELEGAELKPSTTTANGLLQDAYLNMQESAKSAKLDACVVLEAWVQPGATSLLPNGALLIYVEDVLVGWHEGLPYKGIKSPYTKFEHLSNETFYADSPIVDLIDPQNEYNELRTDIGQAGKRMARPQMLYQEGSLNPQKVTNEPGQWIPYRMGFQAPGPVQLTDIPEYYLQQQDRALQDFEDISGQHDVSKGQAPSGVSAGTAMALLKEADDSFLTPQYHNVEEGVERIATHTLILFNLFVDIKRKIKVVGADGAFDVEMLQGSDIASGMDVRVERGSSVGVSQAAKRAQVLEYFQAGLIDQQLALKLAEVGGAQKVLDIVSVAEKKALRENTRMQRLAVADIQQVDAEFVQRALPMIEQMGPQVDEMGMPVPPPSLQEIVAQAPPVIQVDDFDMHQIHIEAHNRFRMSQAYETLPNEVKQQFAKHVQQHQQMMMQVMQEQQAMTMMQESPNAGAADDQEVPPDMGGVPHEEGAPEAPAPEMGAPA